jgi:hypothetical protein
MPESVKDRPTKAHEYMFLLTKSERYYYDLEAVREPLAGPIHSPGNKTVEQMHAGPMDRGGHSQWERDMAQPWGNPSGRNRRTTDWYDYDAAIRAHKAYIRHLEKIRDGGGMLTDFEDGVPIAFHVNPKGYSGAHFATFPPDLVSPCIRAGTSTPRSMAMTTVVVGGGPSCPVTRLSWRSL